MKLMNEENTLKMAALKSGMDVKTARKYLRESRTPENPKKIHTWRTRRDPFEEVWTHVEELLSGNEGLEAKTIFSHLKKEFPENFDDGQLRTLQRRIKIWRATKGSAKATIFPQIHEPGKLCASDFTHMSQLAVTIQGRLFEHLIYHFVLTYSNWETGTICYSESFESLSEGLQNALWRLGGVPSAHRTDRLSAAVNNALNRDEFTRSYQALLDHYHLRGEKINAGCSNENGDVEQSHFRFKKAVEQSLLLRGSRDFENFNLYENFLNDLFDELNNGRKKRLKEELYTLGELPECRLNDCKKFKVKVSRSSIIHVSHNVYSVHSRLIGETVEAHLYADRIEVWYAGKRIEETPRKRGENGYCINYRHIIDWLVRKPGAFENYLYRDALFPTSYFRMAYDFLKENISGASREYLNILHLAAKESESGVNSILRKLIETNTSISFDTVRSLISTAEQSSNDVHIDEVNLADYDALTGEVA